MGEIIDLQSIREQINNKEQKERERIDKEIKKRRRIKISIDEAYILLQRYIGYMEIVSDGVLNDIDDEEEREGGIRTLKYLYSMLTRLLKKYIEAKPLDDIVMSWNLIDIHESIVSLELIGDNDIQFLDEYEHLPEDKKIELHLYQRLKEVDKKYDKKINPNRPEIFDIDSMSEFIKKDKLENENLWNIFHYNYNQEFSNRVIIIEEIQAFLGDTLVFNNCYIKKYPKGFRKVLNQLQNEDQAVYTYQYEITLDKENPEEERMYSYPQGWRIFKEEGTIEELQNRFKQFRFEYYSLFDAEVEYHIRQERALDIEEYIEGLLYDIEGIVHLPFEKLPSYNY